MIALDGVPDGGLIVIHGCIVRRIDIDSFEVSVLDAGDTLITDPVCAIEAAYWIVDLYDEAKPAHAA